MSDSLLTPDELGRIYKVTGRTIRQWHQDGVIPAEVEQGRTIRFDPEEVAAALKKNARKARRGNRALASGTSQKETAGR